MKTEDNKTAEELAKKRARDFIKKSSPLDDFGVRADLIRTNLFKHTVNYMVRFSNEEIAEKQSEIDELVITTGEYLNFIWEHTVVPKNMHETWANLHMNLENILNKHKK